MGVDIYVYVVYGAIIDEKQFDSVLKVLGIDPTDEDGDFKDFFSGIKIDETKYQIKQYGDAEETTPSYSIVLNETEVQVVRSQTKTPLVINPPTNAEVESFKKWLSETFQEKLGLKYTVHVHKTYY
jgi:hypothetical protein